MSSGLAFHVHHDILIEHCHSLEERVEYIKRCKPPAEQPLRLERLKIIPPEKLPNAIKKADAQRRKALAACDKASRVKADAWEKAYIKRKKTLAEWDKAIEENMPALIELHKELCPNCPFDGHTIFTRKDKDGNWY